MRVFVFAIIVMLGTPHVAQADWRCSTPLGEWQPRDALVAKLESEGWRDIAIRVEDGCYLIHARNAAGERLHGKFDPATLAPIHDEGNGRRHERDEHRRDSED
jgi:hypothetical protein